MNEAAATIKAAPEDLVDKINKMADDRKTLEKKLHDLSASAISAGDLGDKAFDIDGISVVPVNASPADGKIARSMIDKLASKHDIVVLSTAGEGKPALFIKLNKKAVQAGYNAMKLMQELNKITGGKGGGRPDSAQGGGGDPEKIDHALDQVKQILTDIKD